MLLHINNERYRTLSGFSLGDAPEAVMSQQGRRGSEQVTKIGNNDDDDDDDDYGDV